MFWNFRSLGNALYPEPHVGALIQRDDFRSLGNALYPEPLVLGIEDRDDFRSLGNALYPEQCGVPSWFGSILDHWEMRSIRNLNIQRG